MLNNILKVVVLGVGLFSFTAVNAQDADKPQKKEGKKVPKFVRMDTNKDKKISLVEYEKYRAAVRAVKGKEPKKNGFSKRFKEIDVNKDGFLNREEFKNRKETKTTKKK